MGVLTSPAFAKASSYKMLGGTYVTGSYRRGGGQILPTPTTYTLCITTIMHIKL